MAFTLLAMESLPSTSRFQNLARHFWMFVAPAALSLFALLTLDKHSGWFAFQSIAFLVALAAGVVARWIDPLDTDSDNLAPPGQVARHVAIVVVFCLMLWAVANWFGAIWVTKPTG